jgi:hypothetical protein
MDKIQICIMALQQDFKSILAFLMNWTVLKDKLKLLERKNFRFLFEKKDGAIKTMPIPPDSDPKIFSI